MVLTPKRAAPPGPSPLRAPAALPCRADDAPALVLDALARRARAGRPVAADPSGRTWFTAVFAPVPCLKAWTKSLWTSGASGRRLIAGVFPC